MDNGILKKQCIKTQLKKEPDNIYAKHSCLVQVGLQDRPNLSA